MRAIQKRIKNADLYDKRYIVNNHYSYKQSKRIVNKKIRRMQKENENE